MSKLIKLITITLLFSNAAIADVTHVTLWEPMPGKSAQMLATASEAAEVHKSLGAQPGVAVDTMGRLHFIMSFADWAAWGAYQEKAATSKTMQSFVAKISAAPPATQIESFMLNQPLPAPPGGVYNVFVWEVFPGRGAQMMEAAMQASAIHTKDGANVAINLDQKGRLHYVMSFDNWQQWGAFQDNPSKAWQSFFSEFNADPAGKVVQTYMARQVP